MSWQSLSSIIYPAIFGIVVFVMWQGGLLNILLHTDTNTLPSPSRINSIIMDNQAKIFLNLKATVIVALVGLLFGSLIGYGIAIVAAQYRKWGAGGITLASAFNAVPIVALAPVMNNLTKHISSSVDFRSMLAKTLVVMIVCIAGMSVNAYRGLTELKPFSEDLMKTYAAGNFTVFKKLLLPNSIPYVFTALRISLPGSIISALVTEYFSEKVIGIGRQIRENIVTAQFATAWAYIIISCLLGIVLYVLLLLVESVVMKNRNRK
ncbi:MAG: ABC transporter permease subunit [Sphaerochaetaceae bacterium]